MCFRFFFFCLICPEFTGFEVQAHHFVESLSSISMSASERSKPGTEIMLARNFAQQSIQIISVVRFTFTKDAKYLLISSNILNGREYDLGYEGCPFHFALIGLQSRSRRLPPPECPVLKYAWLCDIPPSHCASVKPKSIRLSKTPTSSSEVSILV